MSRYERNKGVLTPTTWEDIKSNFPNIKADEDLEWETDQSYVKLNGIYYRVSWEVNAGDDYPELVNLKRLPDGSIEFETYHYNGGAHWTELVEYQL